MTNKTANTLPCTCVMRASLHVYASSVMSSVLTSVNARSPALWHSTLTHQLLQASINELEVVVDESNVQMGSLKEQLDAAQQRLDTAEADVIALQATETNLQQQLQSTQVGYYLTDCLAHTRSQCCISNSCVA